MRRQWCVGVVIVMMCGILLGGCPWPPPGDVQFTSADVGNSRGSLYGPESPTDSAGEGEGEGDGGGTPRTVTEPDVIRRDGALLYVLNQYRGLSIVDLDTQALLAQVPTRGFPRDLYLVGDKAYVLTSYGVNYTAEGDTVSVSFDLRSRLHVVNVAEPANAAIEGSFDLTGDFIDSRLVGDVIYAVTADYQWYADGGVAVEKQQTSNSRVVSIAVGDPDNITKVDEQAIPGYGNLIQATPEAIFVATNDWNTNTTAIRYIDISDPDGTIVPRGSVEVPGYLADRFKMDAYDGVLRVVSNTWWPQRQTFVTTADLSDPENITVLGQVDLPTAAGDTVFATRFDGPRAYIVTYFLVDPLHVIDLSDPANPRQSGELEVPGWSTHIEPRGDRLIALGVDDTGGARRVSVSLFDVADPAAPALLDRESFGEDWSWSTAYADVKAFTVLDGVLIVPFSGWNHASGGYERLQFLSHTRNTLDLRGSVDLQGQILRSLAYADGYYAVTTEQVAKITGDIDDPAVEGSILLSENVADVQELPGGGWLEIITRYDTADVLVRSVDGAGEALDETVISIAGLQQSFLRGNTLALLGATWDNVTYEASYHVTLIDAGDPANLAPGKSIDLGVQPYWGGWWYDGYGPLRDGDAVDGGPGAFDAKQAGDIAWWGPWWWWAPAETAFLAGDYLVARCFADEYDALAGSGTPQQGLAVLNLDTGEVRTVGLAYDEVRGVDAAGPRVYLSTKRALGQDVLGRGIAALYVTELDPATLTTRAAANVPGEFVSYDPAADLLLVRDYQYDFASYEVSRTLHALRWEGGGSVALLDSLALDDTVGSTLVPRPGRVYHDTYDNGFGIGSIVVGEDGSLANGPRVEASNQWGYLLGASDTSAYAVVAGNVIARYTFDGGPGLADVFDVMSSPARVRIGARAAYAPLGYSGLAVLPL